jgi:hypothetical protein
LLEPCDCSPAAVLHFITTAASYQIAQLHAKVLTLRLTICSLPSPTIHIHMFPSPCPIISIHVRNRSPQPHQTKASVSSAAACLILIRTSTSLPSLATASPPLPTTPPASMPHVTQSLRRRAATPAAILNHQRTISSAHPSRLACVRAKLTSPASPAPG